MSFRPFSCGVLAVALLWVSEAGAQSTPRYLALGDSIAYGYDPTVQPPSAHKYVGYPEVIAAALRRPVANAACVFETSSSFLSAVAPDLGCREWKNQGLLHVNYASTQMEYAVAFLSANRKTQLVTINIGGNDLAALLFSCQQQVPADPFGCALAQLPGVLSTYGQNLAAIYTAIRSTGYSGPIIALTYYASNYNPQDPVTQALAALNQVTTNVTLAHNGKVADGFKAFQLATLPYNGDACAAGLLVRRSATICDSHPSALGQKVLAAAVAVAAAQP